METGRLQIFYLKKRIVFPFCTMQISLTPSKASMSIQNGDKILVLPVTSLISLFFYKNKIATLSEVTEVKNENNVIKIMLKGLQRARIKTIDSMKFSEFDLIEPVNNSSRDELCDELRKKTQEMVFLINIDESDRLIGLLNYLVDLNQITDFIANYFVVNFYDRKRLFNEIDLKVRSRNLLKILDALIADINKKTGGSPDAEKNHQ